jgi:hypothetical protein
MDKTDKAAPEYEAPKIEDYGDLKDLTAGNKSGQWTDATFPVHTPFKNLTFSG